MGGARPAPFSSHHHFPAELPPPPGVLTKTPACLLGNPQRSCGGKRGFSRTHTWPQIPVVCMCIHCAFFACGQRGWPLLRSFAFWGSARTNNFPPSDQTLNFARKYHCRWWPLMLGLNSGGDGIRPTLCVCIACARARARMGACVFIHMIVLYLLYYHNIIAYSYSYYYYDICPCICMYILSSNYMMPRFNVRRTDGRER